MFSTIFLWFLAAYGGAVLALFRPFVGFCIYFAFQFVQPQYLFGDVVGLRFEWNFWLGIGVVVGTIFLMFRSPVHNMTKKLVQGITTRGENSILWIFSAFMVVFLCSVAISPDSDVSERAATILLKIFIMVGVGFYLLDSPRRLNIFLWIILLGQAFITLKLNKWYFIEGTNFIMLNDGYGPLNNNTFALFLLPGIGLAIMGGIYKPGLIQKSIAFFAAVLSIHVVLLSESRGGYLGVIVILLVVAWYVPKDTKTILAFFFVGFSILALSGESVQKEFDTIFVEEENRDKSAQSRFWLWEKAFDSILEHPLLGVGPNTFSVENANGRSKVAHNLYLQMGAESGIPALFLFVFLYLQAIRKSQQVLTSHKHISFEMDPALRWGAGSVVSGLLGYLTHSMFSAGIYIDSSYALILVALVVFRLYCVQKQDMQQIKEQESVLVHAVQ
jgi:O-antigen ligase